MQRYGYIRETPGHLTAREQYDSLQAAGCVTIFQETDWTTRPGLARALDALGRGDMLTVHSLDRLAWTVRELRRIAAAVAERGAGLQSVTEPWANPFDLSGAMQTLTGLAAFEVSAAGDRRAVVLIEARARGVSVGRSRKLGAEQEAEARRLYFIEKWPQRRIADVFQVHPATISRIIRDKRIKRAV